MPKQLDAMDAASHSPSQSSSIKRRDMRLLIQHAHRNGEISGVTTSITEMLPALTAFPGVKVQVISTKELSIPDQLRALWSSDAVMLNSNCFWLTAIGRLLGKRVLLKLHYTQYQTVHWEFTPMSFHLRIAAELRHLLGLHSSAHYKLASIGRLAMRTAVALMASRVCAPSQHCAMQASLPKRVSVHRNPMKVESGLKPRDPGTLYRPPHFVFIGRISREKGWDVLVEATRMLHATRREFMLDVVGDGPEMSSLREAVSRAGIDLCVRFHGKRSQKDAKAVLEGALAAVVPSRMQEAFGYVPLEAASLQVVSIVSCVGGLPETAGECCPRFESGEANQLMEAMAALLDDPHHALEAGRLAYKRAFEMFEPSRIALELLTLLGLCANGLSVCRPDRAA